MTTIKFGHYKDFKPKNPVNKIKYTYPWDKITKTGQEYGFFVGLKKKPKPPNSLKHRTWAILNAEFEGQRGYYIYIKNFTNKNFTNGYTPE